MFIICVFFVNPLHIIMDEMDHTMVFFTEVYLKVLYISIHPPGTFPHFVVLEYGNEMDFKLRLHTYPSPNPHPTPSSDVEMTPSVPSSSVSSLSLVTADTK